MPRKNVSFSDEHKRMLEELEETGVGEEIFGEGFVSSMLQYNIERVYRDRLQPERLKLEKKKLELEKEKEKVKALKREIENLEDISSVEEPSKGRMKEEHVQFFDDFIEDIETKIGKSRTSFEEQYKQWESGRLRSFRKKFYRINEKTFREQFKKRAEENGHNLEENFLRD